MCDSLRDKMRACIEDVYWAVKTQELAILMCE